ncbi:MAG: hypothetical protein ACOYJJ_05280 [Anaerovoracaceae bacterium]|jgi:hypothetical protein
MISLEEKSTQRLIEYLTDDDVTFAVFDTRSSGNEIAGFRKSLREDARAGGLNVHEYICRWTEGGEESEEDKLLIPGISFKTAVRLGTKYEQSTILFKDREGIREICTAPFASYQAGDIVSTCEINREKPLGPDVTKYLFAAEDVRHSERLEGLELYERQLLNTRLGFTLSRIDIE